MADQINEGDDNVDDSGVVDVLAMSDEDFLNAPPPADSAAGSSVAEEPVKPEITATETGAPATNVESDTPAGTSTAEEDEDDDKKEPANNVAEPAKDASQTDAAGSNIAPETKGSKAKVDETGKQEPAKTDPSVAGSEKDGVKAEPAEAAPAINYEEAYNEIMKPFVANGKTIQIKDPKEAIQLMQMGANYTRKMQDIAPHRKALLMLENNGLLNEDKLSFLIDLEKKNPQAIQKLIKESGIDPMEIDITKEPAYLEGNHKVGDQEVAFQTTLNELSSTQEGKETLVSINGWDQASKEVLWKNPEVFGLIHEARTSGVYALVVDEMERQKTLGIIPAGTPFLTAYNKVGDELVKSNVFQAAGAKSEAPKPADVPAKGNTPAVVATRTAAPKAPVTNGDKVSAASPTRSTPKTAQVLVNPLAMSDEEFEKFSAKR